MIITYNQLKIGEQFVKKGLFCISCVNPQTDNKKFNWISGHACRVSIPRIPSQR